MLAIERLRIALFDTKKAKASQSKNLVTAAIAQAPEPLLIALLAGVEVDDTAWLDAWLDVRRSTWDSLEDDSPTALILARSESPKREDALDAALGASHAPRAVRALARAGVPWEHRALTQRLLNDATTRPFACAVLAMAAPDALIKWALADTREEDALRDALRAYVLCSESPGLRHILDIYTALREDEEAEDAALPYQLEALILALQPAQYARGAFDDTFPVGWASDPICVADILVNLAETSWLETLATLELAGGGPAFELAALLAVGAAGANASNQLDATDENDVSRHVALCDALRDGESNWEARASSLGFQLPMALVDEELAVLLVEVAVHERLLDADLPSPGVIGLPLSATLEGGLDIAATRELLREAQRDASPDEETVVACVRTLCDLHALAADEEESILPLVSDMDQLIAPLCDHAHPAIALAARRTCSLLKPLDGIIAPDPQTERDAFIAGIDVPGAPARIALLAAGEGCAALWAARELTELPLEDGLPLLITALARAHACRAPALRQLIHEAIEQDSFN